MAKYYIPFSHEALKKFDEFLCSELERIEEYKTEVKLISNEGAELANEAIAKAKATQAT